MANGLKFNISSKFDGELALTIARDVFKKTMNKMRNEAILLSPSDTSELSSKIQLDAISEDRIDLWSLAPYSAALEYGTVPFWAPIAPLMEWAKRKFGDEDMGYAVQKKIAKEGISAHPFMRPALDVTKQIHLPIIIAESKNKFN